MQEREEVLRSSDLSLPSPTGYYSNLRFDFDFGLGNMSGAGGTGGSGGGTSQGSAAAFVYKLKKPKMGDLVQIADGVWAILCGGTPLADWTGIDGTFVQSNPNQLRYPQSSSAAKHHAYRKMGLEDKFEKVKGNFRLFKADVGQAAMERGFRTILCLKCPDDGSKMRFVIEDHQRYSIRDACCNERTNSISSNRLLNKVS